MAPKKSPADLVVTSPDWQVPSREQLEDIDSGHIKNHVLKYNEGLRSIRIEVLDADKQAAGTIQKFELSIGEDGIPLLPPSLIAQLIRARGIRYAVDEDRKVQFRVWLHGRSATTREWTQQLRFTVDPQVTEDYQDAGEPEDDEDDDFDGPDDEEPGGDEEDVEEDDEDEPIAATPNGRDRVMQPPQRQPDPRVMPPRPSPSPQSYAQPQYAAPEPRPLPATHVPHPSLAMARELGLEVKPENVQMQFSPDFMLALIDAGSERVLNVMKPMLKEFRLGMQTVRRESSRTSRESRLNARMVSRAAVEQQKASSDRQTMLEDRLIKISELNYSHYENFQLIAQQGWTAFRNSMEKEAETYTRMREYDRALLGQQLTFERGTDRSSAAGGILSGGAPIALMLGSAVMRMRGDEKSDKVADDLAAFAQKLLPNKHEDDEDEDDEDLDDEDVIDTEPKAPPRDHAGGNGHARSSEPRPEPGPRRPSTTPAIMGARALLDSLSEKQIKDLRKILPAAAWQGVLDAANAEMEYSALASLVIVKELVSTDMSIQLGVMGVLDNTQKGILLKLVSIATGHAPKGRRMPRRPQASAGG